MPEQWNRFMEQGFSEVRNDIRLPQIEVPKFSGDMEKWTEFRELFETMIHGNAKLSNILLQLSANNYVAAWDLLNRRFNNNKLLVFHSLKRVFTMKYVQNERADEIKQLLDSSKEIIYSLKNMGEHVEHWDCIIIFTILRRLPNETLALWEQSCSGSTDIPKFEQLENFLEQRFRTIETIERKQFKPNNMRHVRAYAITIDDGKKCPVCKKEQHSVFACKTYNSMDAQKRLDMINKCQLCTICLRPAREIGVVMYAKVSIIRHYTLRC